MGEAPKLYRWDNLPGGDWLYRKADGELVGRVFLVTRNREAEWYRVVPNKQNSDTYVRGFDNAKRRLLTIMTIKPEDVEA